MAGLTKLERMRAAHPRASSEYTYWNKGECIHGTAYSDRCVPCEGRLCEVKARRKAERS